MKFILNVLISALIIATVAYVGKRYSLFAALLLALPLTSMLAIVFLYYETKDIQKISELSYGIFWLVLPTLLFFLILPGLLKAGINFWASMGLTSLCMIAIFFVYTWGLKKIGVYF